MLNPRYSILSSNNYKNAQGMSDKETVTDVLHVCMSAVHRPRLMGVLVLSS